MNIKLEQFSKYEPNEFNVAVSNLESLEHILVISCRYTCVQTKTTEKITTMDEYNWNISNYSKSGVLLNYRDSTGMVVNFQ